MRGLETTARQLLAFLTGTDIPGPLGGKTGFRRLPAEDPFQGLQDVEDAVLLVAGNVEDFPAHPRGPHRQEIAVHHIINVGKIPGLSSVPMDLGPLSLEETMDKDRDHGGVTGLGILAGSKDIEIPQRNGLEPVERIKETAIMLPRCL